MRLKIMAVTLLATLLTMLLCGVPNASILGPHPVWAIAIAKGVQISTEVIQLTSIGGRIPVEIKNVTIQPSGPIDVLTFNVKNNTNKIINAVTVEVMVKGEYRGKSFISKFYMIRNQVIHPDISEIIHQKSIAPDEEISFDPEPLETYIGIVVKGISLKIDFVDFADKTSLGPNEKGSIYIYKVREGAARYKAWLVKQYESKDKATGSLMTLLRETSLPPELDLRGQEIVGAKLYRKHLIMAIVQHGDQEAIKYIKR